MLRNSFVRGVMNSLVANDRAVFPDHKTAADISDYIAENLDFDPTSNNMTYEKVAEIANYIVDASNTLLEKGFTPSASVKTAATRDFTKLAHDTVVELMQKAAEGSNYEGGDKQNNSATSAEGKMDEKARPEGYSNAGVGSTAVDTKPGAVGAESDNPEKQKNSPAGSNSVTEQRTAGLRAALLKVAEGSNFTGGDKGNTAPSTPEGKMDATLRPEGYANSGVGNTAVNTAVGEVGKVQAHPETQANSPAGSNSLKSAAEDPFITLFKKTAEEVHAFLPAKLDSNTKIAHVKAMMGMNSDTEKAAYINAIYKKEASLPPWLMKKDDDKKEDKKEDGDKKDEGKKEAKCEKCGKEPCVCDKKEASLKDIFATIAK